MDKILIIDDSLLVIAKLTSILNSEYEIHSLTDATIAVERAIEVDPCLILLDVIMPNIDGFQTISMIKSDLAVKDIPVIFLTGLTETENEERGFDFGAVDYITKPFYEKIVLARVRTHVELYKYRRAMENLAWLDGLTGIKNRRYYDEFIKSAWRNSIQKNVPMSLMIADIDDFKKYNDNYGHLKGDDILKIVARAIQGSLKHHSDLAARYGGEEFIIVLPGMDEDDAKNLALEVNQAIQGLQIEHKYSSASEYISVSIGGITLIPDKSIDYLDFVNSADEMLYQAKKNGRNQFVWTNDIVELKNKKNYDHS